MTCKAVEVRHPQTFGNDLQIVHTDGPVQAVFPMSEIVSCLVRRSRDPSRK